ncbi:hypothetical protein ANOM_010106 [Aspergillus nomiae NRRL 13137]|uniref:Uncharacterized protein n=1 Tax=Aspergillus nomiae NRRL (strain ATCC 15546 / NRRL 13137 / CBS 260.88 / M93) TaxID=1509407 RepID=A0A0L1ISA6_ASPN3|nr:uncharacterized protein ANOM_010106 [Aspergillus nomiae NRRL 13137]KNG82280.1 hypothetical protein ANOM_010106 [Aspergillus nomiae NRRL 13137]
MSALHIPPVTIEDLQAFQAKHFPGSAQSLVSEYASNENVADELADDDDGLGYYPDGVKRTLTDEQIKIFRHSEIHSLLRERQLREEEEESLKVSESNESKDDQADDNDTAAKRSNVVSVTDQSTGEDQQARALQSNTRQSAARNQTVDNSTNPTLDYDEDASGGTHKSAPSGYHSHLAGRRIVSYED